MKFSSIVVFGLLAGLVGCRRCFRHQGQYAHPLSVRHANDQFVLDDVGQGDVTTTALVSRDLTVEAEVVSKEAGVAAGIIKKRFFSCSLT